ncbi:ATP adenylyltransferase [Prochlorococcus marinus]|uniref:ATP adenylyltransferase n=1 Tax=Prochlorococcus marinus XMU1408 TaxID=2213228 RepID=A0A318R4M8_PROMR|nr:ATP adenylyltransferase [Prochlorococcus marinus]MBW3041964.1 ATP adenylyltransferase [Prochlorococcus marinus str. XMU1408]PYE03090.1 ATP adenylyltransferase [Prochlorococcus marinus XMU1408]
MKKELIWSKALETSRKAVNSGAVIPLDTIKYKNNHDNCDYELRFLNSPIPKYLIEYGPKNNPFIPWDSRLEIQPINDKHTLILNKYPVQIGHMLLITNIWKAQNGWLNIDDFRAIVDVDNDTTGLWFFNSSKEAGASQPHRHFQLLRRHTNESICPRYKWFCSLLNNKNNINSLISHCISIKARVKDINSQANGLYKSYKSMAVSMGLGEIGKINKPRKAYNLLITSEWIALITREKDISNGFSINALGFAGYFLGTKKSNINYLIKFGPEEILKDVVEKLDKREANLQY